MIDIFMAARIEISLSKQDCMFSHHPWSALAGGRVNQTDVLVTESAASCCGARKGHAFSDFFRWHKRKRGDFFGPGNEVLRLESPLITALARRSPGRNERLGDGRGYRGTVMRNDIALVALQF
jgi:hypothetical protein